ncbi:hypothetical protein L7F22_008321 [Adiantum nelumboides]|nr:hypothetical protein [Adiantum nelumboides]
MGKYMKKARGGRGVLEVMTQGPLGVITRARTQAMQKEVSRSHSSNAKVSTSTSMQNFIPAKISYLELRSRRLEKVAGCMSNKVLASRKSASAGDFRRLTDLTNSGILADDSSSRLAFSVKEARHQIFDENHEFLYYCHGDNEAGESSLQGFVQSSLQQWTSRGRAPPGVAHSRSNSRSNSVSRELPPPIQELPASGILTRNRRKLELQTSEANACPKVVHLEVEHVLPKALDVEVSCGENPMEEVWSAGYRLVHEESPKSDSKDGNKTSSAADMNQVAVHQSTTQSKQTLPVSMHSSYNMEIEDFFLEAEQKEQSRFIERYNFDPESDRPLPGRYDWVEL